MAPKEPIALTAGEQKMLTAVVSLMGDVPEVDFNVVAELVGQKYARNARSSCKKLFEKLRASGNGQPDGAGSATTPVNSDAEDGEGADNKKKTPAKAAPKKAAAGKVAKKGTAKPTPKKAAAPKAAAKGKAKKEAKAETKEEENMDDAAEADEGKSTLSDPFVDNAATMETEAEQEAENDRYNASARGMPLAEWLEWKAENPYEASLLCSPPTPGNYNNSDDDS